MRIRRGSLSSASAAPTPFDAFTLRLSPLLLTLVNAIRLPSPDHTGKEFAPGPKVERVSVPRARSWSQMSRPPVSPTRSVATVESSGEIEAQAVSAGIPTGPADLPLRSNQVSCFLFPPAAP